MWVVIFKVCEHMIGAFVHGKGLAGGFHDLVVNNGYEILSNALVMLAAFVPFFAIKELQRVFGREKLYELF